jgi:hypothetical protein
VLRPSAPRLNAYSGGGKSRERSLDLIEFGAAHTIEAEHGEYRSLARTQKKINLNGALCEATEDRGKKSGICDNATQTRGLLQREKEQDLPKS